MEHSKFIENALREASRVANENFGKVISVIKEDDINQVVTETDLAIGKYLGDGVKETYPEHNILDEEAGVVDNNSPFTWVIDPIDGTSNFSEGLPFYGIMIGLLDKDTPVAGGVALPYFNELYLAQKGKGTFCNDEKVAVTNSSELLSVLVAYGIDGHQEDPEITYEESKLLAEIVLNIRNLRTSNSAYDMVMVAKGKYGAYLNRTTRIWDNVAPQIVIEEAGGIYTDFFGKPVDYSNPLQRVDLNFTACASSPELHKQIQAVIHKQL
jgi:myo-inositol-1(or 4)-monophosphatase